MDLNLTTNRLTITLLLISGSCGSASTDCEGLRIFDVAVNDSVVLDDLDIWAESGHDGVCKKISIYHSERWDV